MNGKIKVRKFKFDKSEFFYDPIFHTDMIPRLLYHKEFSQYKEGWFFWVEPGALADVAGPWKTEWDAEKMLSLYCLDVTGSGNNKLLYINRQKVVLGAYA